MPHCHCTNEHCDSECAEEFSLFKYIDTTKIFCLNEKIRGSSIHCFRAWEQRLDTTKFVESNGDEELLIFVPFTGSIKLKSLVIIGGPKDSPKTAKIFVNKDNMDFSEASELKPTQELDLVENSQIEYPLQISKFSNVSSVTIYIPNNFGNPTTRIYFISFKGTFTPMERKPVITTYEQKPNPADHKTKEEFGSSNWLS